MKILRILIFILCLVIFCVVPILASTYTSTITLVESSGNSYTNYPFFSFMNNDYLSSQGYISSTGLDVNTNVSGTIVSTMVASDRTGFLATLNANQSINATLSFGDTAKASNPIIVGHNGYITTTDAAGLELGSDFACEINGYLDTSSYQKYLIYKSGAFGLGTTSGGSILGYIASTVFYHWGVGTTADTILYHGNITRVGNYSTASSFSGGVKNVDVKLKKGGSPTGTLYCYVRSKTDDSILGLLGTLDVSTLTTSYVTHSFSAYPIIVYPAQDIRVSIEYDDLSSNSTDKLYVGNDNGSSDPSFTYNATYTDDATGFKTVYLSRDSYDRVVTATLASGLHTVKIYNASGLKLDIDSVLASSTTSDNVPNSATVWEFNINNASTVINYYKHTVGGVEVLKYQPVDIIDSIPTTYTTGSCNFGQGTYVTGTANFIQYSATVTGSGTSWTSDMVGGSIKSNTDGVYYSIYAVNSPSVLTLTSTYAQAGGSGHNYTLNYTLPSSSTITPNKKTIVGSGTTFTNSMVGGQIVCTADGKSYNIASVTDTTHLILTSDYLDTGGLSQAYTITYALTATLINEDSASYSGVITWGTNPAGVVSSLSALTSADNIITTVSSNDITEHDFIKAESNQDAITNLNPNLSGNILTPLYQPFSDLTNIPLIALLLGLATAIQISCVHYSMKISGQNQLIGSLVSIVIIAVFWKMGIYEWWYMFISILISGAIIIMERKPVL
jgi:hypothetical protein